MLPRVPKEFPLYRTNISDSSCNGCLLYEATQVKTYCQQGREKSPKKTRPANSRVSCQAKS